MSNWRLSHCFIVVAVLAGLIALACSNAPPEPTGVSSPSPTDGYGDLEPATQESGATDTPTPGSATAGTPASPAAALAVGEKHCTVAGCATKASGLLSIQSMGPPMVERCQRTVPDHLGDRCLADAISWKIELFTPPAYSAGAHLLTGEQEAMDLVQSLFPGLFVFHCDSGVQDGAVFLSACLSTSAPAAPTPTPTLHPQAAGVSAAATYEAQNGHPRYCVEPARTAAEAQVPCKFPTSTPTPDPSDYENGYRG